MDFGFRGSPQRALVLAGGGVAGIAWEIGVLRGLADADRTLAEAIMGADLVIGTSAGSAVAAQITSGTPIERLYETQLDPESSEIRSPADPVATAAVFAAAAADADSPADLRQRIGMVALDAVTVDPGRRLAAIRARLPVPDWPDRRLWLVAVEASTGDRVVFDRFGGVSLLDAVAASCAVPGMWPPVAIADVPYIDGGVWSGTNADLAAGVEAVVVLTPALDEPDDPLMPGLREEIADLRTGGTRAVEIVRADADTVAAFGDDPLDPATRAPCARAGRRIGRAAAERVAATWAG